MKDGYYYKELEQRFHKLEALSDEEIQELKTFHETLYQYYHGSNAILVGYHSQEMERYQKILFHRNNFD